MKLLVLATFCIAFVFAADVEDHLKKFGFMNELQFDGSSIQHAIEKYQRAFHLNVTGVADEATISLMSTPRCGRPDNDANNLFADTAWRKKDLSYYYNNYTPDLSRSDVRALTEKAFKFWADVAPLHFKERSGGDIVVSFGSRSHHDGKRQCGFPFDGRGGVLAHAFFPPDGRLHFDEDEGYTARSPSGTNYLWVATHELGHILGLEHDTNNREAVMYPYYRPYRANMQLHSNDIARIRRLYGSGRGSVNGNGGSGGSGGGGGSGGSGDCKDVQSSSFCSRNLGNCNAGNGWKAYMEKNCKKTCNFCSGGSGGGSGGSCVDKVVDCQRNIKGCSQWGQAWKDYMAKHCRKSCRLC